MSSVAMLKESGVFHQPSPDSSHSLKTHPLGTEHTSEVLNFLAARPLHTVILASFIRDNGIISPLNRGTFYACRDEEGQLEGVALIGHATLIEAHTEAAIILFSRLAQNCSTAHLIMGEQDKIETFWHSYADNGQSPRLLCREMLFELCFPVEVHEAIEGLRLATLEDLEQVMLIQANMAFEESGVNPMEKDPEGFRRRCTRRVEQGRVWVLTENGKLIFKADIISETPEVAYLEGIYVTPEERNKGYGLRCTSQLGRSLLGRVRSVSILVNEQNAQAQALYRKVGYRLRGTYDTIFLQQPAM